MGMPENEELARLENITACLLRTTRYLEQAWAIVDKHAASGEPLTDEAIGTVARLLDMTRTEANQGLVRAQYLRATPTLRRTMQDPDPKADAPAGNGRH